MQKYDSNLRNKPFKDYDEYMQYVFNCVNTALDQYIDVMKSTYANEQGGYKSILYPDIEIAGDTCRNQVERFYSDGDSAGESTAPKTEDEEAEEENEAEGVVDEELMALLGAFSVERDSAKPKKKEKKRKSVSFL